MKLRMTERRNIPGKKVSKQKEQVQMIQGKIRLTEGKSVKKGTNK